MKLHKLITDNELSITDRFNWGKLKSGSGFNQNLFQKCSNQENEERKKKKERKRERKYGFNWMDWKSV